MKLPGVSIVVCCYNSKDRLPETLKHIALQQVPEHIKWEVVIVDNNSTDNTSTVAEREWKKYAVKASFTVVKQPVPGLNAAREKGFETAKYEYVICCDDDNWLSSNYIKEVALIFDNHADVGVVGTKAIPQYEDHPPEWFKKYNVWFALGAQGKPGDITDKKGYVWGAGMAIRHTALANLKKTGYNNLLTDRVGSKMTTGGDVEVCFGLRFLKHKVYYTEKCSIHHYMPKSRFDEKKFFALSYQNGFSTSYLDLLYRKKFLSKRELVSNIRRHLTRAPKQYVIKRKLGQTDFEEEVMFKSWQGRLSGLLFLLRKHKKLRQNFECLT